MSTTASSGKVSAATAVDAKDPAACRRTRWTSHGRDAVDSDRAAVTGR